MYYLIFFVYLWPSLFTLLNYFYNPSDEKTLINKKKLVRHFISSTNLTLSVTFSFLWLITSNNLFYKFTYGSTITYFIWDLYYIFMNNLKENAYVLHHLCGLLLWQASFTNPNLTWAVMISYFFAEASNIPMFIVYYLLKTKDTSLLENKKNILRWKYIQVILYGSLRLIAIPLFAHQYYLKFPYFNIFINSLMNMIVIYWQYHITKTYIKDKKEYEILLKNE